jgi:hypothetical protein
MKFIMCYKDLRVGLSTYRPRLLHHAQAILEFRQVLTRPFRELNELLAVKNTDEV